MKRRKMRRDNRSSHTILVSVEGSFCPDAACEVVQKPVLPWELQQQGNACLNHCAILQNYIVNLPRLAVTIGDKIGFQLSILTSCASCFYFSKVMTV